MVSITLKVSDQFLRDILCTACEGGSNYWASFRCTQRFKSEHGSEWQEVHVTVHDEDGGPLKSCTIGLARLRKGLETLLSAKVGDATDKGPRESHFTASSSIRADVFRAIIDDDAGEIDSERADCILQYACFGGLIFG